MKPPRRRGQWKDPEVAKRRAERRAQKQADREAAREAFTRRRIDDERQADMFDGRIVGIRS